MVTARQPRQDEAGFALLLALLLLVTLGSSLAALAVGWSDRSRELARETRRVRAEALRDSVLAETLAGLAQSSAYRGVDGHELEGGWVESSVERRGRLARVSIVAELGPTRRAATVTVELVERRPRVVAWSAGLPAPEAPAR